MAERIAKFEIVQLDRSECHGLPPYGTMWIQTRDGEPDYCRHHCPCGCGGFVALLLVRKDRSREGGAGTRWDFKTNGGIISPSIRDLGSCHAHYFVKEDGTVEFYPDSGR